MRARRLALVPMLGPFGRVLRTARFLMNRARVMHELALMEDLIQTVSAEVADARVHVVRLCVGRDACASPHALSFCFEICTHGTPLEGAVLEIVETGGDELRLAEVEVS